MTMVAFRWVFGIVTAIMLAGWIALAVLGGNFRRAFGASPVAPLVTILPVLLMVLVLITLLWPGHRPLLHATAALAVLGLIASATIVRESAATGVLAAGYLVCWLVYYWLALKSPLAHG